MTTATKRKPTQDHEAPEAEGDTTIPLAAKPDGEFTFDDFIVERNIPIPQSARRAPPVKPHPFVEHFDLMGHNDTLFIPTDYWVRRGTGKPENITKPAWQTQTIRTQFAAWKKRDPEGRSKFRLTVMAREEGEDTSFPTKSGCRCWLVDTTR